MAFKTVGKTNAVILLVDNLFVIQLPSTCIIQDRRSYFSILGKSMIQFSKGPKKAQMETLKKFFKSSN